MRKSLILAAGLVLAASAAAAAPKAASRNIDVVAMTAPAPASGRVCPVFFAPDSARLTPAARRIIASAVRLAARGQHVSLVVAEAGGPMPVSVAAPLWRARIAAVKAAIAPDDGRPLAVVSAIMPMR